MFVTTRQCLFGFAETNRNLLLQGCFQYLIGIFHVQYFIIAMMLRKRYCKRLVLPSVIILIAMAYTYGGP